MEATNDTRHPSTREADMLLWERIVGTSPRDEVRWAVADHPTAITAEDIATGLWEFGTNDDHDDLDREAAIESLARTLHFEGGAPLGATAEAKEAKRLQTALRDLIWSTNLSSRRARDEAIRRAKAVLYASRAAEEGGVTWPPA